ncbi:MAG: MFS transporter, partial [Mesorhizobium sp.]
MALEQTSPDQRYAAFRHRPFLSYWVARFLTTFATMIVSVAVGWQVYDLTRDPFDLGIVGIVQFLPSLLLV